MSGKKFLIFLISLLLLFAISLYLYMYVGGWFDIFLKAGFKGLYGE
jgi:hypothetical protein